MTTVPAVKVYFSCFLSCLHMTAVADIGAGKSLWMTNMLPFLRHWAIKAFNLLVVNVEGKYYYTHILLKISLIAAHRSSFSEISAFYEHHEHMWNNT